MTLGAARRQQRAARAVAGSGFELASQARRKLGAKFTKAARTGQALALSSHGPNQALQKLTCAISLKVQGKHEGDVNGQKAK
jgi:hypothetical protein